MSHTNRNPSMPMSEVESLRARIEELERVAAQHGQAAEALRECTERFRAVADYTYDVESWLGPDGRLLWVNPAVERLTGYTVAECLAMANYPVPLVHEEDAERISHAFHGAVGGSSGNDLPFRLRHRNGSTIWVAVSWQPIYSTSGACLGHRSSIRDISDRKRAEDALLEERRLLTSIIAHIPSGVFWKGRDYRYLGCNEAFARSAGVARPEDIVGKTDYELAWEPEQADYFRACDRRVMEEDRALLNIEEVERQADGRQARLLTSKVPLHDREDRVYGVLGIDTDISELKQVESDLRQIRAELEVRVRERTADLAAANEHLRREIAERERAEAAARENEQRYRLVSELTSDYAYSLRVVPGGGCEAEWVTDAFSRMTGHGASELEGHGGWERIVHPDDLPVVERRGQCLRAGRSAVTEFRIVAADGRICWLRDHVRPIWDEAEHRVVRVLGAAQDITARKEAEEEARRHQAALAHVARITTMGELAAQLAHELNQPLCTIVGNAQTAQRLLAAPAPDLDDLRDALNDIVTSGKRAGNVIRHLREFLRRQEPQPLVLNVQRLIEEVAGFLEADARQHRARLRFDIADGLPAIRGDAVQLQQVLLNLVRNGLEAMTGVPEPAREVIIRAGRGDPDGVVICVSDHGPGLERDVAGRVFEPFFTTKPGGLGLGLAISRSIVEAHGGRVWVEPASPSGTAFLLFLPTILEGAAS